MNKEIINWMFAISSVATIINFVFILLIANGNGIVEPIELIIEDERR